MNPIFIKTPLELVIKIFEYSNSFKYRNGQFISQILDSDERRKMLQKISQIKPILYSNYPIFYERELGKYFVRLNIDNSYDIPRFRYVFQRKREKNDTSIIILYFHELK